MNPHGLAVGGRCGRNPPRAPRTICKKECDSGGIPFWLWILAAAVIIVVIGLGIWSAVCITQVKKDLNKWHHELKEDSSDGKDWKYKDWGSKGDYGKGWGKDCPTPVCDCQCETPTCECNIETTCVVPHNKKNCSCENLERAQDAWDELLQGDPWRFYKIIDFKRFWANVKAPRWPVGGSFHGVEGLVQLLRRLMAVIELKSAKSLGQWSLADCSCRFVKLRHELEVKPRCPLHLSHYDGVGKRNEISPKDLPCSHCDESFTLHFQWDIRFDHNGSVVGFDLFLDSATLFRKVKEKCICDQYGYGWNWNDYVHENWDEWQTCQLPYPTPPPYSPPSAPPTPP